MLGLDWTHRKRAAPGLKVTSMSFSSEDDEDDDADVKEEKDTADSTCRGPGATKTAGMETTLNETGLQDVEGRLQGGAGEEGGATGKTLFAMIPTQGVGVAVGDKDMAQTLVGNRPIEAKTTTYQYAPKDKRSGTRRNDTAEANDGVAPGPVLDRLPEDPAREPPKQQSIEELMVQAWLTNPTIVTCIRDEGQKAAWQMLEAAASLWAMRDGVQVPTEPPYPIPRWVADGYQESNEENGSDQDDQDREPPRGE